MRAPNRLEESATNSPLPFPDQCHELANFVVRVAAVLFVPNEHCQHHFGLPVRKLDCSSHLSPSMPSAPIGGLAHEFALEISLEVGGLGSSRHAGRLTDVSVVSGR